jgi:hypothetical protein
MCCMYVLWYKCVHECDIFVLHIYELYLLCVRTLEGFLMLHTCMYTCLRVSPVRCKIMWVVDIVIMG